MRVRYRFLLRAKKTSPRPSERCGLGDLHPAPTLVRSALDRAGSAEVYGPCPRTHTGNPKAPATHSRPSFESLQPAIIAVQPGLTDRYRCGRLQRLDRQLRRSCAAWDRPRMAERNDADGNIWHGRGPLNRYYGLSQPRTRGRFHRAGFPQVSGRPR